MAAMSHVVPAKAGTHTPRRKLVKREGGRLCLNNNALWLWAPAFAGTTAEIGATAETTPPAPRRRHSHVRGRQHAQRHAANGEDWHQPLESDGAGDLDADSYHRRIGSGEFAADLAASRPSPWA